MKLFSALKSPFHSIIKALTSLFIILNRLFSEMLRSIFIELTDCLRDHVP